MAVNSDHRNTQGDHGMWTLRRSILVIVAAAGLISISHLILYTGFALDDWFPLAHAHFGGMWQAGDIQAGPRPGQWLVFALTFGTIGRHPVPYVVILGLLSSLIALSLLTLLRQFVTPGLALMTSLLWLFLPNHTTMEVWASAVNINVAVLTMLLGFLVGLNSGGSLARYVWSGLLLAFAVLTYDATAPVAVAGVILIPIAMNRRLDWKWISVAGPTLAISGVWILTHWNPDKQSEFNPGALGQVIPAHFGWGIVPEGTPASVLTILILTLTVIGLRHLISRQRPSASVGTQAAWCIAVGWLVILLSLIPFMFYIYGPLGAGDRVNCVSSMGGALVLTGALSFIWIYRRDAAVVTAAALVITSGITRYERTMTWSTAFADADRILAVSHDQVPQPQGLIVFGPSPIQHNNIAAFIDQSNIDSAVKLHYGDPRVHGAMAFSEREFYSAPPNYRIDIWPISNLTPTVDLRTDR